jgi:hypothetical protein
VQSLSRVIAAIFMVVAVVGILTGLSGVAAVWVVKARYTADAAAALDGINADLQAAEAAVQEIGPRLDAGRENLSAISVAAGGVGEKLGQPRVVELAQGVQGKLSEIDGKVREANDRLGQMEAGVNHVVELANKLPGVEVPALDVKLLDGVSGLLSDANGRLKDLADEATGGKVTVTQEMGGIEQTVQQVRGDLAAAATAASEASARLAVAQGALNTWAEQLLTALQQAAVLLTVGLLWFVVGQVGLFMWMWSVYRQAAAAGEAA